MTSMGKSLLIIFVIAVILSACNSKPDQQREQLNNISSTNKSLSILEKDKVIRNERLLKNLNEDLDGDTHPEDISLILLENSQDPQWYDISIRIDGTEYNIFKYCTNQVFPDQKINLQTLQSADQSKFIVLSASISVNGNRTDGEYRANVFLYKEKKITPVWDGTYSHSQSDFQYIIDIDKFTLELPDESISFVKKFKSDSKYSFIMTERKKRDKTGKSIPSIFLDVLEIENLGIKDYDNDGLKEIITQNAIFLEDNNIYIGSLYTIYRPKNLIGRPDKIFMLDRYGISSRIIKEIIDNGHIQNGNWGSTLSYWIETKYNNYTEKDIEKALNELEEQKIIVLENDAYKLLLK